MILLPIQKRFLETHLVSFLVLLMYEKSVAEFFSCLLITPLGIVATCSRTFCNIDVPYTGPHKYSIVQKKRPAIFFQIATYRGSILLGVERSVQYLRCHRFKICTISFRKENLFTVIFKFIFKKFER